jgi:peptidoglycan hydrolase-like protein with peptidoglycan-binding domain
MKKITHVIAGACGLLFLFTSIASAEATLTMTELTPSSGEIFARNEVSFRAVASGFTPSFTVSDSFSGSSIQGNAINGAGKFYWSANPSDVGTHILTITANDYSGNIVTLKQTIVVKPPPSISIQSISPGNKVMPGSKFSFTVANNGFTNPKYSVSDSFSGSTAPNVKIDSSGNFSWTPQISDNGDHTLTVYASDSNGHSNSASVEVSVGEGPSIKIPVVTPGASLSPGQTLTFTAIPMNFSPSIFSVSDNFPGTTLSNQNIDSMGVFSWMTTSKDVGTHVITVKGTIGVFGKSAEATQTITVLGPGGVAPTPTVLGASTAPSTASDVAISALQAQLTELNAKIASQSAGAANTPAPTSSSGGTFTTYLYSGMEGDEVLKLQKVLKEQGFFSVEPNGSFGPLTVLAVKKFQVAHGLSQLGVVGPGTRAALNALKSGTVAGVSTSESESAGTYVFENFIAWGDKGTEVLELQKRLKALGFFEDEPSGYFGNMTFAAVVALQNANGIDPKGHVGPATRAVLNK